MKRRTFILYLAGGAAGLVAASRLRHSFPLQLSKVSRSNWALGAQVKITVFHNDTSVASTALDEAFSELEHVEQLMSLYRADSQISLLNQNGFLENPHPHLLEVLKMAAKVSQATEGAFDITVQPLWKLYSDHAANASTPDSKSLAKSLAQVDWRQVAIMPNRVELQGEATAITLNGIAQGFAADRVRSVLESHGIRSALIDTGEIGAIGVSAEKDEWTIGIKHPRQPDSLLEFASLKDRCLATSGDYESRFGEGYENHHLLDPSTGRSPVELASVSVVAPTAMQADALSTAVFVLGIENGRRLITTMPDTDALFVTKDGNIQQTKDFPVTI